MIELSIGFLVSSFVAGLVTFLAPCTLPLVPGYLAFISGVPARDLKDPAKKDAVARKVFRNGVAFILGFSVIFVLFGTLVGFIGSELAFARIWLSRIGGALIILFGLFMLGVFRLPLLERTRQMKLPGFLTVGKPSSSFVIGGTFALGWTPCVGPILGSILLLAGSSATALEGALLLAIFSLGLALPFIVIALLFSQATAYINRAMKYLKWFSVIGGLFLIFLGLLLLTGNFGLLIAWGFEIFGFLEYDAILDLL